MTDDKKKYDVVAIGAVCADIQIFGDDALLEKNGLTKARTAPIGAAALESILEGRDVVKTSGSPGTNVATGIAQRGGAAALIGKVANDASGQFLACKANLHGVDFMPVVTSNDNLPTSSVLVVTTPDKERSFAFVAGACYDLMPEDIDESLIRRSKVTYLDSYLWSSPSGQASAEHAAAVAKSAGSLVAISLNDAGVIAAHQADYLKMVRETAHIILGDAQETMALFNKPTLDEAVDEIKKLGLTASITMGSKGAYIVENGEMTHIPTRKVDRVCDTTGAGDQFAAGVIYGISQGKTAVEGGHIGACWASEVIQHKGAEPRAGRKAAASL